jgi:hypothetical protein
LVLGLAIGAAFIFVVGLLYYLTFRGIPGVIVSSWWRMPWKNDEVGGKAFSLHQIGWGFDLVPDGPVTQAQVIATGLPFLKFQSEGDHLHVQIF